MEKKKGSRPTWTQVRELEAQVAELRMKCNEGGCYDRQLEKERDEWKRKFEEQLEGTSGLVRDSDIWRENYRDLYEKHEELLSEAARLTDECKSWREKYHKIKNRGFWSRVFNR